MEEQILSVKIFKALGDDRRLAMLYTLHEKGPLTYTELASSARLNVEKKQAVIANHIKVLCNADLIQSGHMVYTLTDIGKFACDYLIELNEPSKI